MEIKGFKRLILYITLVMIIIISPNVYAYEYNLNSHTSSTKNGTTNRYSCLETYQYGSNNTCTFGTTYNGRMGEFDAYISYPFEGNTNYVFTLNMNNNDFRNNFKSAWLFDCEHNSISTVYSVNYISYRKIKINYTPSENTTCARLLIRSKNYPTDAFTGVNNWTLSSLTLYDPDYQTGGGSGQGTSTPAPTPPTATNQDIINNANNNTQDIINNQNENTNDIIENANENTETLNNSINSVCKDTQINLSYDFAMTTGKILTSTGSEVDLSGGAISVYFNIKPNTNYTVGTLASSLPNNFYYCLYSATKGVLSCSALNSSGETNITTNGYASYLRISMYNYRQLFLSGPICNDWEKEGLKNIADSINNDNIDNGVGSNFFNDFDSDDNGGISAIVSKPLMIINNLLDNNGQCTNLTLPSFLGIDNAYLPSGCILWDNASTIMVNLWNMFVCGLGSYFILKDLFHIIENLKNPDNDKVEVMDL